MKDVFHCSMESPQYEMHNGGKGHLYPAQKTGSSLKALRTAWGLRAFAVLPVRHNNQVIGCINLASNTLDEVPLFCRLALETISAQMGSAIVRLRAEEALRKRENQLETKTQALEEVNAALKVLLQKREEDKKKKGCCLSLSARAAPEKRRACPQGNRGGLPGKGREKYQGDR